MCRLVEGQAAEPRVIATDLLASCAPAIKQVYTRAEHSHQLTRQREWVWRRFRSPELN